MTEGTSTSGAPAAAEAGDLLIMIDEGGVTSEILLQDAIAADAVVTDEASAEAAVGCNFFVQTPEGTLTSLDVDTDANLSTAVVIDASAADLALVDNAEIANNVELTGVADGDTLTLNADADSVPSPMSTATWWSPSRRRRDQHHHPGRRSRDRCGGHQRSDRRGGSRVRFLPVWLTNTNPSACSNKPLGRWLRGFLFGATGSYSGFRRQ